MALPLRLLTKPGALAALLLGWTGSVVVASPALAESPTAVSVEVDDDGVFVAPDPALFDPAVFDTTGMAGVVDQAAALGLDLVIIAAADPAPDAGAFSLRVRQAADVEAVLLFGPQGEIEASVVEAYTDQVIAGLQAARSAESPVAAAEVFVGQVTAEPDRSVPGTVRFIIAMVFVMVAALVGAVALDQSLRRRSRAG